VTLPPPTAAGSSVPDAPAGLAPAAPGRLGEAIPTDALLVYLGALDRWRVARKSELDRIDAAARSSPSASDFTGDITLAMALWQSITDRAAELQRVWDSGRVGTVEREKLSQLIWGRLDAGFWPLRSSR